MNGGHGWPKTLVEPPLELPCWRRERRERERGMMGKMKWRGMKVCELSVHVWVLSSSLDHFAPLNLRKHLMSPWVKIRIH